MFSMGVPYLERVTRGILDHARAHGPWHFAFNAETAYIPVESLRSWRGDGIIGMFSTPAEARRVAALGIPAVNIASAIAAPVLPTVTIENQEVGRLAARHLIERGFRRFGYFGVRNTEYGRQRGAGFIGEITAAGLPCSACWAVSSFATRQPWRWDRAQLERWLRGLQPPVGVLAVHDYRARLLLETCAKIGLRVPADVAVVGVDDDVVVCELAAPPLTSVALPGQEIGRRAAELLGSLMRGGARPRAPILVAPPGVVARRSTDVFAHEDVVVRRFVEMVRDQAGQTFNVDEIARGLGVSRRVLERRAAEVLDATPLAYLRRSRVAAARALLAAADPPSLKEAAARTGFSNVRHMNVAFVRELGQPSRAFRRG